MSRLMHVPSGRPLAERLEVARSAWQRMRGLLGRDRLPPGGGMLFPDCSSIHTFFMRFALDLAFVSADLTVTRVVRNLRPWRLVWAPGARHVVELPAGALDAAGVAPGDALRIEDS